MPVTPTASVIDATVVSATNDHVSVNVDVSVDVDVPVNAYVSIYMSIYMHVRTAMDSVTAMPATAESRVGLGERGGKSEY